MPDDVPIVSVLYTVSYDLYCLPAQDADFWLSVATDTAASTRRPNAVFLGSVPTADAQAWRKAYSNTWSSITPGNVVALPGDDPLVLDYQSVEDI